MPKSLRDLSGIAIPKYQSLGWNLTEPREYYSAIIARDIPIARAMYFRETCHLRNRGGERVSNVRRG
jgi:hypothetical protein